MTVWTGSKAPSVKATSSRAIMQTGPVLMGLPWHAAMSTPGVGGFVDADPDWASSPIEGGHEVCVIALEDVAFTDGALDPDHTVIRFRNSWGTGFGDHGDGRLFLRTYLALREEIDLIQPRKDGVVL